jgi:hypothetical protein
MSSLHTSQPACSDRPEFSSNPENHVQGETVSCHQHKKALKDLSDFIHKPVWFQMAALRNTRSNQKISRNTISHSYALDSTRKVTTQPLTAGRLNITKHFVQSNP